MRPPPSDIRTPATRPVITPLGTKWRPTVPKVAATVGWGLLFLQQWASGSNGCNDQMAPTSLGPPTLASTLQRPLNILCLDGGGIKGRNQMVMVEELEAATGRPLGQQFDLIAGTSIGGCGALFLAHFQDDATAKARSAMHELQHSCFASTSKRRLLIDGHFCADQRRAFMMKVVGPRKLSVPPRSGPRAFALASRRTTSGLQPYLLRTYPHRRAALAGTHRAKLSQAVEATSAAPFMFPRTQLGGTVLVDGGMIANDPTLVALQEASSLWPGRAIGLVVSLGTGEPDGVDRFDGDDASGSDCAAEAGGADARREALRLEQVHGRPRTWAPPSVFSSLPSSHAHHRRCCRQVERAVQARGGRYFRFQPPVSGISPIEVDEDRLCSMEAQSREYFRQCHATAALCTWLSAQQPAQSGGP